MILFGSVHVVGELVVGEFDVLCVLVVDGYLVL